MTLLIKNIKKLIQVESDNQIVIKSGSQMSSLHCLDNAFLIIEGEKIQSFGKMEELSSFIEGKEIDIINAEGRMVMPAFCDSHTHLVYAGSREMEYIDKIKYHNYC